MGRNCASNMQLKFFAVENSVIKWKSSPINQFSDQKSVKKVYEDKMS